MWHVNNRHSGVIVCNAHSDNSTQQSGDGLSYKSRGHRKYIAFILIYLLAVYITQTLIFIRYIIKNSGIFPFNVNSFIALIHFMLYWICIFLHMSYQAIWKKSLKYWIIVCGYNNILPTQRCIIIIARLLFVCCPLVGILYRMCQGWGLFLNMGMVS